jgi:hypothetical protein
MNTVRTLTICIVVSLATAGCASQFKDIKVETVSSPTVAFGGDESYAWAAAAAIVHDPDGEWTMPDLNLGAEIVHLVNREFRARGMTEAAESPDLLVIYAIGVDMKALDVVVDSESDAEAFEEVAKGGPVLIVVDATSNQAVWIGGAVANMMKDPTLEQQKQRLDYAVTKMIARMPR